MTFKPNPTLPFSTITTAVAAHRERRASNNTKDCLRLLPPPHTHVHKTFIDKALCSVMFVSASASTALPNSSVTGLK